MDSDNFLHWSHFHIYVGKQLGVVRQVLYAIGYKYDNIWLVSRGNLHAYTVWSKKWKNTPRQKRP